MCNILFCGNYKVFDGILLASMSMAKHTKSDLNIFIITADLSEVNPEYRPITEENKTMLENYLKSKNPNNNVTLIQLGKDFNSWVQQSQNKVNQYTPFMFLRLFADKVENLPSKIIYLDCDVMINNDIQELFDIDMTNLQLGIVKDRLGRFFINPNYFNSGMLLMNLDMIKKTDLFTRVLNTCLTKKMAFPDQTALNKETEFKIYLPRKFNEQGNARKDTVVQHFCKRVIFFPYFHTKNIKQWQIDDVHNVYKCHQYDDIYEEYLNL